MEGFLPGAGHSGGFVSWAMAATMAGLVFCLAMLLLRFLLGPTKFDRLAAMESITLATLCLAMAWGAWLRTEWLIDFVLVFSLLGYLSTVALAKFLEGGSVGDD